MKLSPQWIREFVDLKADDAHLAEHLTLAGIAVETISGAWDDTTFEMDITTNRPDAMNHYGVAREASAIYNVPLKSITPKLPASKGKTNFAIQIDEPELCPRFTARVIRGVNIVGSPDRITRQLALLDQRPINNAVDATNYVLWEIGKPTHVFDLDLLEGGKLIIRRARAGETLTTLDGVERKLTSEDLVVADARKAVGLAGVMGGFDTMITAKTKNILIESAWWDPVTVRKMARRHGLHTDASHRFERGADYDSCVLSTNRVAELILASGGGELEGEPVDVVARPMTRPVIALRLAQVTRILGMDLGREEITRILERLGFKLTAGNDFNVQVPSWRLDVEREIDLIEEIARHHGYNKFASTLPTFSGSVVELPDAAKDARLRSSLEELAAAAKGARLRSSLLALGYNETIALTFVSHADAKAFSSADTLEIANPLSEEASCMRPSMVPGMLDMLAWNLNRGTESVRLFEAGNVFDTTPEGLKGKKRICLGAAGNAVEAGAHQTARAYSFFDLKGDVETLLSFLQNNIVYAADEKLAAYFHPGRAARAVISGHEIAQFGQIDPDIASARKIRQAVFVAEINLDLLYDEKLKRPHHTQLPKFPAVERDFSFVLANDVTWEQIHRGVMSSPPPELRGLVPVEVFLGGNVPSGKYSLLLRARFQSPERTLREEEVAQWAARIIAAVKEFGGVLRT